MLNTTATWIVIILMCAFLVSLSLAMYTWRDASKAAYYFQKRESYQRMQSYSLVTIVLLVLAVTISMYAAAPQTTHEPIIKILTNAKPQELIAEDTTTAVAVNNQSSVVIESTAQVARLNPIASRAIAIEPSLPTRFQTIAAEADLTTKTSINDLAFATEINDAYSPINQSDVFGVGNFNLYATFDYAEMQNGLSWAWVWKHNGDVIGGGEQMWEYGNTGPGYVYFNPAEGFSEGEYSLEIWLNGELVNQNSMDVVANVAQ